MHFSTRELELVGVHQLPVHLAVIDLHATVPGGHGGARTRYRHFRHLAQREIERGLLVESIPKPPV